MDELKQLTDDLRSTFEDFKSAREDAESEIKRLGDESGETKAAIEKMHDAMDELEARFKAAEFDTRRDAGEYEGKAELVNFARKGVVPERKDMIVGDESFAGIFAPVEFVNELIKGELEFSPIRGLATVRRSRSGGVRAPKRTGTGSAKWVSETGTREEDSGLKFGAEEIPVHEASVYYDVSFAELEDSIVDVPGILSAAFAEEFGVLEGTAFVTGNGVGKPEGITFNSDVSTVDGLDTTNHNINADDFSNLLYALKTPYIQGATFVMSRAALKLTRQLKDQQDNYIWTPGLAQGVSGGAPATILDRPYVLAADMDDPGTDNNLPVMVGNFKRAYWIVDRIDLAIQRDPYTQAGSGLVRFTARKRLGGQVVNPEAIKVLKV
jgi:HK97 family phage major capsid protein